MFSDNFWFGLLLFFGGLYLFVSGFRKMTNKKYFLKNEGMPGIDIENEYKSVPEGDIVVERYIRPFGWFVLGIAFVGTGAYIIFFKI